jgi:diacylglycerol kinase family enzyme
MKKAKLLHNPNAGSAQYDDLEFQSLVKANGFECDYSSVKEKDWEEIDPEVDFLIVGGGDGTVRKTVKKLLERKLIDGIWPIALLPLGTANNIASTLGLKGIKHETLVKSWHENKRRKYDIGRLRGAGKAQFFMEGFGFGLFPYLIKQMDKDGPVADETPDENMKRTLKKFHELILSYEAKDCQLVVNGKDYSGKFLLAEVMNTQCIGPNMAISPDSNPSDGWMEVVVIPEGDREKFASYIEKKIQGNEEEFKFQTIKASKLKISWNGSHAHADDEMLDIKKATEVMVEIRKGILEFLVP